MDLYFSPREKRLVSYTALVWLSLRFGRAVYKVLRHSLISSRGRRLVRSNLRTEGRQGTDSGSDSIARESPSQG